VCTYTSRDGRHGSTIFFSHDSSSTNSLYLKVGQKHFGRISSSELDPQPWHFTNDRIVFPFSDNSLGWTLYLPSTVTSLSLLTSPTHCQRELVSDKLCTSNGWTCIGTAQVGASLVAPLDSLLKRSSLRSPCEIILVFVT